MVLYHNWRHAFNVCQLMFAMLTVSVPVGGGRSPLFMCTSWLSPMHFYFTEKLPHDYPAATHICPVYGSVYLTTVSLKLQNH